MIKVRGALDLVSVPGLISRIREAELLGSVVVSLAACTYCDTSTLTLLCDASKRLESRLRVVLPEFGTPRRLFDITGLLGVLPIANSENGALDELLAISA